MNHGPCAENNCGFCCDPVKVHLRSNITIPKDAEGNEIWTRIDGIHTSQKYLEIERLVFYTCKNYNSIMKSCNDYENRPQICRNTSCITNSPKETVEEQWLKAVGTKFIRIK